MSLKISSCSCASDAKNDVISEYPFRCKRTTNFEIIRFKPLKERLLDSCKYPTFTYRYFEDIEETLLRSCNFEDINEVLYYLERNPDIHDIVPPLLKSISCELKKEGQQRVPILLKALYCLYTNTSVSAASDFSVCTNALEHFLTKSSTFPGDYVLKDIAADILSDICEMSPSDDLKEHTISQLSSVFHNPNCHSYNLYGGIVGCLSNMSVKSGPEVVPHEAFSSNTFWRNVLSSPRILDKLSHLCKPLIYSSLPSVLIPRPLHNKNSFYYDIHSGCADVINLMRSEMITPISSVKYDHMFSENYEIGGGYFDTSEGSNVSANCKDCLWPGFSAYQREKMLKNEETESSSQIDSMCKGSLSTNEGLQNSQGSSKSDDYEESFKKRKFPDFDKDIDYTKRWLDSYGGHATCSKSETNPLIDRESDSCIEKPRESCKQNIHSDFLKRDTDSSKSEENFLIKKEGKLLDVSQKQLQVNVKEIGDNMDIISNENDAQVDSKESNSDSKSQESLLIENNSNSYIDSVKNFQEENKVGDFGAACSERNLQDDSNSNNDTDSSIMIIAEGKSNLVADQLGQYDWELPLQDEAKPAEHIEAKMDEEMMMDVDSHKAKKCGHPHSPESVGFRTQAEYSDYLAWRRERTYADTHKRCYLGDTLKLIPPPENFDRSVFDHYEVDDFVYDTHVISSSYITEEDLKVKNCCEISHSCKISSSVSSSPPDLGIFKNLDKNMFANWEYKKPKNKKESTGEEKSDTKSQSQKKSKTRGKKK